MTADSGSPSAALAAGGATRVPRREMPPLPFELTTAPLTTGESATLTIDSHTEGAVGGEEAKNAGRAAEI